MRCQDATQIFAPLQYSAAARLQKSSAEQKKRKGAAQHNTWPPCTHDLWWQWVVTCNGNVTFREVSLFSYLASWYSSAYGGDSKNHEAFVSRIVQTFLFYALSHSFFWSVSHVFVTCCALRCHRNTFSKINKTFKAKGCFLQSFRQLIASSIRSLFVLLDKSSFNPLSLLITSSFTRIRVKECVQLSCWGHKTLFRFHFLQHDSSSELQHRPL